MDIFTAHMWYLTQGQGKGPAPTLLVTLFNVFGALPMLKHSTQTLSAILALL